MIQGNEPIELIQGDSYTYEIHFTEPTIFAQVDSITFSSDALSLKGKMSRDEEHQSFYYHISAQQSEKYIPLETCFDIIVHFNNGTIESETGIPLKIHKRHNSK